LGVVGLFCESFWQTVGRLSSPSCPFALLLLPSYVAGEMRLIQLPLELPLELVVGQDTMEKSYCSFLIGYCHYWHVYNIINLPIIIHFIIVYTYYYH
jgi:hypothetical protein